MSELLEVRKTYDGKVFARRKDGLPLTAQDREEAKRIAVQGIAPLCWSCGAVMEPTKDIHGNAGFACWSCATWA